MKVSLPSHASPGGEILPPSASTEVPLEMLAACHGRIEAQCATLRRLQSHLRANGVDVAAREAATALMRYFDTAALHHHQDEESDLFPALIESMAGSDAVCLQALTRSLAEDHRVLEAAWQRLRSSLAPIAAGAVAATLDEEALEAFVSGYERHLEREDRELLPMAARLLGEPALRAIGAAMRQRRGIATID